DLDTNHAACHDRRSAVIRPVPATQEPGMHAMPGFDADDAIARIGGDKARRRLWPGGWFGALEPPAMARGTSAAFKGTVGARRRIAIKDPVVSNPTAHLGTR